MELEEILHNPLMVNAVTAWLLAQVIKTVIHAVIHRKLDFGRLFGDGGMPSGHSATVTALAVSAGMKYGFGSGVFAVSAVMAVIVMHDAMSVRLEAGKHAKAINDLVEVLNSRAEPEVKLKEFLGHTPLQVCFGALLGLAVALIAML